MVLRDTFSLLGSVRLLLVLCPAAAEHILHAKAQTPSPLLLLLILSGKRLCSRSCQNDAGDTRRWVFKHRYISPKIIWSKEKSKFQSSCIDHGLYITLSRQGFCFTGIMRNTVWLIFHQHAFFESANWLFNIYINCSVFISFTSSFLTFLAKKERGVFNLKLKWGVINQRLRIK